MSFSFGNLFGYEKMVSANTPEICFENCYKKVKNGDLETLIYVAQLSMVTPQMLEETSGLIKGYLQRYLIKILEKTDLHAETIKDLSETTATVEVVGVTTNLDQLFNLFQKEIQEHEQELGLQTDEKINMRKVGLMLDILEACILECGTIEINEVIDLEKNQLEWEIQPTPALTKAFLGLDAEMLEKKIQDNFGYLWT